MFNESLPSNEGLFWLYCSGFRASCHSIKSKIVRLSLAKKGLSAEVLRFDSRFRCKEWSLFLRKLISPIYRMIHKLVDTNKSRLYKFRVAVRPNIFIMECTINFLLFCYWWSRDSSDGRGPFPGRGKRFSVLHSDQISGRVHPASHAMGTVDSPRSKAVGAPSLPLTSI
jgi:hypothetical protein